MRGPNEIISRFSGRGTAIVAIGDRPDAELPLSSMPIIPSTDTLGEAVLLARKALEKVASTRKS